MMDTDDFRACLISMGYNMVTSTPSSTCQAFCCPGWEAVTHLEKSSLSDGRLAALRLALPSPRGAPLSPSLGKIKPENQMTHGVRVWLRGLAFSSATSSGTLEKGLFFVPMVDTNWMANPKAYRDGSSTSPYLRHGSIYSGTAPSRPANTLSNLGPGLSLTLVYPHFIQLSEEDRTLVWIDR